MKSKLITKSTFLFFLLGFCEKRTKYFQNSGFIYIWLCFKNHRCNFAFNYIYLVTFLKFYVLSLYTYILCTFYNPLTIMQLLLAVVVLLLLHLRNLMRNSKSILDQFAYKPTHSSHTVFSSLYIVATQSGRKKKYFFVNNPPFCMYFALSCSSPVFFVSHRSCLLN